VILIVLTVLSTLFVGMAYTPNPALEAAFRSSSDPFGVLLRNPSFLLNGLPYALALLGILGVHEMGHYVVGRIHKADVTLPYFIPMPFGLGTMGAVILLRSPIKNKRQLFDIGVAGPLAGLAVAIPLLIVGLATSPVQYIGAPIPGAQEGNSILYLLLKLLVHGRILPGGGYDVMLNAIAFPAWFGLFITSLNLLPIGSLDGGHVTYAVFGRRQWQIARAAWMIMLGAGVLLLLTRFDLGLNVWLLWGFLVQLFGVRHPPPLDDITPLDPRRRALGIATTILFFLLIVPIPFS
jgi:membrane-associated protease RseP (regulator of RpoE activity)